MIRSLYCQVKPRYVRRSATYGPRAGALPSCAIGCPSKPMFSQICTQICQICTKICSLVRTSIFRVRIFRPRKFKWSVCVQICSVQISEICSVFNKLLKTLRVVGLRDLTYQANLHLSFSRCLAIRKILSPGSSTRINPPPNLACLSFGALIILWFMVALLWHCLEKILLLRSASRCNHRSLLCLFLSLHLQ